MLAPEAGGERFIATAEFLWMAEVAATLRRKLGEDAAKAETTLGWTPRPIEQTIAETGRSMVDLGVV